MSRPPPTPEELPGSEYSDEEAASGPTLLDWSRFALQSVRRRKLVVLLSFAVCLGACAAFYWKKTPTYRVETRILTLDRLALPTAARSVYEDAPGRSAHDLIHRRDNLVALLQAAGLLPESTPDPASDEPRDEPLPMAAPQDDVNALIAALDQQLEVGTERGTITISVDWANPAQAYALAKAALDNFLEARYQQEVSAIDEVITVLQGHAEKLRRELDVAIDDSQRRAAAQPRPSAPRVRQPSAELVRLQAQLAAKQGALQDVEESRRRRVAELQAQLDEALNTLSEAHPTVIGLRKDLDAASRDSPQLQTLRQEEQELRTRTASRLAREGFGPNLLPVPMAPQAVAAMSIEEDPRVRQAQAQYDQMAARLNAARVELDTARAAFKYRYNVVWPPQMPDRPVSPNAAKIFGLGLLASLVIALLGALAPDVLAGRIVHRVQLERSLGLTVLGEVDRP